MAKGYTVVDHRSTMMSNANDNIIMRTGRVLTTYKKPTSPIKIIQEYGIIISWVMGILYFTMYRR